MGTRRRARKYIDHTFNLTELDSSKDPKKTTLGDMAIFTTTISKTDVCEINKQKCSATNEISTKGWHPHTKMMLRYAVPWGRIKLVLYDKREDSPSCVELQKIFLGPDNYCLVTIPPHIWNGFKEIGVDPAIVVNCASIPHDPDDIQRIPPNDPSIPYSREIRYR